MLELYGHVAKKKPLLTPRHRELCLRFAREHSNWTWLEFANVLWTDESRFTLFQTNGPTRCLINMFFIKICFKYMLSMSYLVGPHAFLKVNQNNTKETIKTYICNKNVSSL